MFGNGHRWDILYIESSISDWSNKVSLVSVSPKSYFHIQNLPYGIFSTQHNAGSIGDCSAVLHWTKPISSPEGTHSVLKSCSGNVIIYDVQNTAHAYTHMHTHTHIHTHAYKHTHTTYTGYTYTYKNIICWIIHILWLLLFFFYRKSSSIWTMQAAGHWAKHGKENHVQAVQFMINLSWSWQPVFFVGPVNEQDQLISVKTAKEHIFGMVVINVMVHTACSSHWSGHWQLCAWSIIDHSAVLH